MHTHTHTHTHTDADVPSNRSVRTPFYSSSQTSVPVLVIDFIAAVETGLTGEGDGEAGVLELAVSVVTMYTQRTDCCVMVLPRR